MPLPLPHTHTHTHTPLLPLSTLSVSSLLPSFSPLSSPSSPRSCPSPHALPLLSLSPPCLVSLSLPQHASLQRCAAPRPGLAAPFPGPARRPFALPSRARSVGRTAAGAVHEQLRQQAAAEEARCGEHTHSLLFFFFFFHKPLHTVRGPLSSLLFSSLLLREHALLLFHITSCSRVRPLPYGHCSRCPFISCLSLLLLLSSTLGFFFLHGRPLPAALPCISAVPSCELCLCHAHLRPLRPAAEDDKNSSPAAFTCAAPLSSLSAAVAALHSRVCVQMQLQPERFCFAAESAPRRMPLASCGPRLAWTEPQLSSSLSSLPPTWPPLFSAVVPRPSTPTETLRSPLASLPAALTPALPRPNASDGQVHGLAGH